MLEAASADRTSPISRVTASASAAGSDAAAVTSVTSPVETCLSRLLSNFPSTLTSPRCLTSASMPLSLSQEENVVDNRPLPAKSSGADAVAAFRAGQTSAKKSNSINTPASASKDKEKQQKKRKSSAPTSPPRSPAPLPASPPPNGSGRKRKVAVVEAKRKEDADEEEEDEDVSPLDAALADFVPASLTSLPATTASQPLWLFQFPAKFDVAAFGALRLPLPAATSAATAGRIISRFQLNAAHYRIIEAESAETSDIVNLFPAAHSTSSTNSLTPGRPFTRVLRITLDEPTPGTASWQHTSAALKRKTAVPPARGLTAHFRPIGYMDDRGQQVGERRGRGFQRVGYETVEEEKDAGEDGEKRNKEKKRRKKEAKGNENDVHEREEVSEKKKKKKDKDRHRDSM